MSLADASESVAEILRAVESRIGFIPNMYGLLAHSPAAVGTYAHGNALLARSSLSDAERTVAFIAASRVNGCIYCVAAHSAGARVGADILTSLQNGTEIESDSRLNTLRGFVEQLVEQRGQVSAEQLRTFLEAGFQEAQVLDVLTIVSLKTLTNYVNHVTHVSLDEAFVDD